MALPSISQSVGRMIGVLEVFERERRPLTSADLIEALGVPRSSLAALLRAMVDLSVLSLDRRSATYLPTAHFARLASWLTEAMVREPRVYEMIARIQKATAETVTLSAPTDWCMEILAVERGNQAISFIAEPGQQISFWGSALGTAYLGTLSQASLTSLFDRARRTGGPFAPQMPLADVQAAIAVAREQGCAGAFGAVFPEASAISIALPATIGIRRCVISVAGPTERIRAKEALIIALLIAEVRGLD